MRSFAVANSALFLYSMAFYAMLLANVLFLTQVWDWSVLQAGFALTPGPIMAAVMAPIGGRLSDAFGQRVVAIPGTLLFAGGIALTATLTDATPDYVTEFLPGAMIAGSGVGLTFASLGSAAVAELPPARFATGSAVSATARQIGAVLGISVLIAVIGTPAPLEALGRFHEAWLLMAALGLAASLVSTRLSDGLLGRAHEDLVDVDVRRLGDRVHHRPGDVLGVQRAD